MTNYDSILKKELQNERIDLFFLNLFFIPVLSIVILYA